MPEELTIWNDEETFKRILNHAIETAKAISAGKYKEAILLMIQVQGIGIKKAVKMIRRSRIEARHSIPIWVGGGCGHGKQYHWPHCKCGWDGKEIHGEGSYEIAQKKICPNLKRELAVYGFRYRKDKPLFGKTR